ncbi:AMMECR1 family protein [Aspergillus taichungensis]|uniref:AMMECR1 family protein n=1 Tax=Aspergillus taichungensis TaxID=482145 RepID=A0A2J5HT30_9EURO|nr:AMMECR1 family protein [Aspergillus taichungensis]
MANPAQCYYCFETLAASYKDLEPPSLSTVEELWERYEHLKKLAALQDNMDGNVDEDDDPTKSEDTPAIKPPGVRRLQSEMSLDSSSSNTPSVMSNNSSHSTLSNLTGNTTPSSQSLQPESAGHPAHREKAQRYPLFVTWNTISKSGHKSLRGCIGTFEAQELSAGLQSYALTSAFDDTRFSPIPKQLLPSLSCSLTLLGTFEPCTNALDWTLGVHGIRISFIHRGRRYGATYLPDVPVEQGWTKEETIKSLMQKAGWDGATESVARKFLRGSSSSAASTTASTKPWDQVSDFRAVKYQGHKASATYAEWQDWRKWVLSLEDGSDKLLSLEA